MRPSDMILTVKSQPFLPYHTNAPSSPLYLWLACVFAFSSFQWMRPPFPHTPTPFRLLLQWSLFFTVHYPPFSELFLSVQTFILLELLCARKSRF
ncbi:hypothetical protein QN277_023844 [Acacia crassicarpa]|uniref:Uncharacterized protein n=1 Tax=Acacia crassicarpa TaxID=499986 RepID=A0AAE1MJG8_9FABA|nr:hypothetical protein QN277_023844 [Acacia crassicarpa]